MCLAAKRLRTPTRSGLRARGDQIPISASRVAELSSHRLQIYIWDLTSLAKPFSPGTRSRSLDSITSLAWNPSVVHILASSSNTGHTVVWDLKSKREITALSFASGGATGLGAAGFGSGPGGGLGAAGFGGLGGAGGAGGGAGASGIGGLGGHSAVKWHPENVSSPLLFFFFLRATFTKTDPLLSPVPRNSLPSSSRRRKTITLPTCSCGTSETGNSPRRYVRAGEPLCA
jgi:hypothetical protein